MKSLGSLSPGQALQFEAGAGAAAFIGLAVLVCGVFPSTATTLSLLALAAAASSALHHAHRRWRRLHRQGIKEHWPYLVPRTAVPALLAVWSALTASAWGALLYRVGKPAVLFLGSLEAGELSQYLSVLGILVAMLTGFYLVMLHRTLDTAQRSAEKLEEFASLEMRVDEEFEKWRENEWKDLVQLGVRQRTDTISELAVYLDELWPKNRRGKKEVGERLSELRRGLQAEAALLSLWSAEECDDFLQQWEDVKPYLDLLEARPRQFIPLYSPARRRLEALIQADPPCREQLLSPLRELKRLEGLAPP